ncbi:hypothetical protein [Kineococcus sp. SYSU DK005]|uniref:hypothetical protein n=1 Tax=Kineococcus sp. SYSU DK005 TaxID=3383126 RepID=UPI003D7D2E6D
MDLDEVQDVVESAARQVGGLSVSSQRDGGYITILIRPSPPGGSGPLLADRRVQIWTSGAEAFFIDVPAGFGHQEFDHAHEGQVAVLHLLVSLAGEYLRGRFEEKEEPRPFGRARRYLEIAAGGQSYRLYRKQVEARRLCR